mmetsp:Transcript_14368/g.54195  ORF Transcript_14368/g.54195 Transcript_14368/m.54195 type:complete len:315 (-) Transcript_14368:1434-2378(-)
MADVSAPLKRPFVLLSKTDEALEKLEMDLSEDTPRVYMKVCNVTSEPIVYKVRTTKPKRYIVRPNQGPLGPEATEVIEISLLKKEKSELLKQAYNRVGVLQNNAEELDRFLVQSIPIDQEYFGSLEAMKAAEGSEAQANERSESLMEKWQDFSQEPQRKLIKKQKLDMHFLFAPETQQDQDPASVADKLRESVSAGAGKADNPAESVDIFEEMRRLRRQYDELVDFSVRLTAEREVLQKHLESTKSQWMREMKTRVALENQLGTGNRHNSGSGDVLDSERIDGEAMSPPLSSGFSLVQIAVIAVVFFFVGRLLS